MRTTASLLMLILLLAACGSPAAEPAPPTAEPTPTPTPEPTPTTPAMRPNAVDEEAERVPIIDQITATYPNVDLTFSEVALDEPIPFGEWSENAPAELGFDEAQLANMASFIEAEQKQVNSVLVVRDGTLVYEYYKEGRTATSADVIWSVTKSVTSLLIGIAADDGLLEIDQPLGEILTDAQLADNNPELAAVTVHDLLTMTSGMFCAGDSCHGEPIDEQLESKPRTAAGERFVYDTGASNLLSAVIEQTTEMPLEQFAAERLFVPLGIDPPPWEVDADGNAFAGKGLVMYPRDLARIGQLILDDGLWEGEQIVSADYIDRASQNHIADLSNDTAYGYLFWLDEGASETVVSAVGYGGQYITVLPDYDTVVVITSDFLRQRPTGNVIIESFIIDALEN